MTRRGARGQSLVLLALTVLVASLLVLATLSVGNRIHERQQLQAAADAAAYSEAVVVARTYNSVAVMNRAIIAQMAAISAVEATMSFTAAYHGLLNNARDTLRDKAEDTAGFPECSAVLNEAVLRVEDEDARFISAFELPNTNCRQVGAGPSGRGCRGLDVRVGALTKALHATAIQMSDDQFAVYRSLRGNLHHVAAEVAKHARKGSPWAAPSELRAGAAQPVTDDETQHFDERHRAGASGPIPGQDQPREMVQATMAARGVNEFTVSRDESPRSRWSGVEYFVKRLGPKILPLRVSSSSLRGTAYFEDLQSVGRHSGFAEREAYGDPKANLLDWNRWRLANRRGLRGEGPLLIQAGYGQDFGVFRFYFDSSLPLRCRRVSSKRKPKIRDDYYGYVRETAEADQSDFHVWRRGDDAWGPEDYTEWKDFKRPATPFSHVRHGLKDIKREGRLRVPRKLSIWPIFVDYDSERLVRGQASHGTSAEQNLWGQPKVQVLMSRDYAARAAKPDPWELGFKFKMSAGKATELDLRSSARLSQSLAVASGLAYYHRGKSASSPVDHAGEPPNLLNPFWRATLVASDVDERFGARGKDLQETLQKNGAPPDSVNLVRQLRSTRFSALP